MASLGANERVIETHNLFIDTSRAKEESLSKGDDFLLNLSSFSLNALEGQFLRLTLTEFSMYKNFTDVNENNNKIQFIFDEGGSTKNKVLELTKQNYETIYDLAVNFATAIGNEVVASSVATSFTITAITPASTTGINGTTDNIITFTLTTNVNHGITNPSLVFYEGKGDSYALLGADREIDGSSTTSGVAITAAADTIKVKCKYPAQRSTTSHIYLRTSLTTGATETVSLSEETDIAGKTEVNSSNILARIPVNTEFCVYVSNTGREFFIDLRQKHITNVRLYLTDQHNRRIGRRPGDYTSNTASGTTDGASPGEEQSTLGNLDFSCVIRADIIEFRRPQDLGLPSVRQNIPSNHPLTYPNMPPF